MPNEPLDRQLMIRHLTEHDRLAHGCYGTEILCDILLTGWKGYVNMTDAELADLYDKTFKGRRWDEDWEEHDRKARMIANRRVILKIINGGRP